MTATVTVIDVKTGQRWQESAPAPVTALDVLFVLNQWLDLAEMSHDVALSSALVGDTRVLVHRLRQEVDRG